MKVIYVNESNLFEVQKTAPDVAMALGYFDGVHIGHQKVIKTAKQKADNCNLLLAVLSFFPHPKSVLHSEKTLAYLEPIEQKIEKLERLGVDYFYVVEFTKNLAQVEAKQFLKQYVLALNAKQIICGFDYTYGSKARGNVNTLATYAIAHQIGFTAVDQLKLNGQKVSSTLIRQYLVERKLREISNLLGCFYKTKYCKKNGLLPNYSLPTMGNYKVIIENDGGLMEHYVTVKTSKKIQFHSDMEYLPNLLTIQWVDIA